MKRMVLFWSVVLLLLFSIPLTALTGVFGVPVPKVQGEPVSQGDGSKEDTPIFTPYQPSGSQSQSAAQSAIAPAACALDSFQILNLTTGKVDTVSRLDYIRGAICSEMPPDFHQQAMMAQGTASLTYAVHAALEQRQSPDPELNGADFSADPQNWKGYVTEALAKERYGEKFDQYWSKISQAAEAVQNYILLYGESPIVAAYHSMSAGVTETAANVWSSNVPYLQPVESEGDLLAPDYETVAQFSRGEVAQRVAAEYPDCQLTGEPSDWFSEPVRSASGYVTQIQVGGKVLHGKDIRRIFDLRSSCFTLTLSEDREVFTFQVKGYGHGVGLSQYGADYLARQGDSFDQILLHYYTDATLAVLPG